MDRQKEVQRMLGGRTPTEFVQLPDDERDAVYERYLVREGMVWIEEGDNDDFFNPKLARGVMLRQEYYVRDDAAEKQIAKEAHEVYYTLNTFAVRSHWLCEFLIDTLADGNPFRVESLIRKIVITVETENIHDSDQFAPTPRSSTSS